MHTRRLPLFASLALLAIAACSKRDPVDDKAAANTSSLPAINEPAPSAAGEPHGDTVRPATSDPGTSTIIPVALQGRWGLTPQDCTSTRGDAKGLLVVGDRELRFYESRAVPAAGVQTSPKAISGNFDFTGEGQQWTKYQSLQLQSQGLVRTEINPGASFTYAKCD